MTTPTPAPARTGPQRPNLPKGLRWSTAWKVDGQIQITDLPGVEMPVNDQYEITGQLWVCPHEGCVTEKWTFAPVEDGTEPCCGKHPTRLVDARVDATDPNPSQGARYRTWEKARKVYRDRRDQAVRAAQQRAEMARQAFEDATRRTAADMRGHIPSIAASGAVLLAGTPLIVGQPGIAALAGVGTGVSALAAYLVALVVRRLRKTAKRDERQARKDRQVARHVAAGMLAAGVWMVASAPLTVFGVGIHTALTLTSGLLLTWAVNHGHWQDLWATRHRLKDLARRRAEAERLRAEEEARRQAEQPAAPQPVILDDTDPAVVGARMAAEWRRIADTQNAGGAFPQMPRTWLVPDETTPITAPINGETVRIGWEYHGQSDPGALVARAGMQAPVNAAKDWLAAVLFDGRHNPSTVSLVDRPGGQANRFTLMITDSLPLGEPVRWQGQAGVKRLSNGTILVHRGRTIDGNDVHHPLLIPGQAFGGLVVGTRGGGKTAGTILYLLNCLAAGIFPILFDPKQLVDYADFCGLFPIGVTEAHREAFTDWLHAERKRRERLMARRSLRDQFGRKVHGESKWNLADDPGVSHNWEEFHDLAQIEAWVNSLTNHIRFERAVCMGGRFVTQGGGLADWGNSVLRGLLNQTEQTVYRLDDHQARLAGRKDGTYTASDLPPLPGMCLVTAPEMPPLPMRDAYVSRELDDPTNVFNTLFGLSAEKVLQFQAPALSEAMLATMRRTGMWEIWQRAQGEDGLDRLLSDAEDEEYGGPSPVPGTVAGETGKALSAEDVILAIAYTEPDLGPTAISRHAAWQRPSSPSKSPALSTITKPGVKLEGEGLLTREGGYRITEKGRVRAAALAATLFGLPAAHEQAAERAAEAQDAEAPA